MIYDPEGNPTSTLIQPCPGCDDCKERISAADEQTIDVDSGKTIDLKPRPGQVIVLRPKIETSINGVEKPVAVIEREERDNIIAIVARTGADTGDRPLERADWSNGDRVIIAPHVFTEVNLGGDSVWIGPFLGVKGVFTK